MPDKFKRVEPWEAGLPKWTRVGGNYRGPYQNQGGQYKGTKKEGQFRGLPARPVQGQQGSKAVQGQYQQGQHKDHPKQTYRLDGGRFQENGGVWTKAMEIFVAKELEKIWEWFRKGCYTKEARDRRNWVLNGLGRKINTKFCLTETKVGGDDVLSKVRNLINSHRFQCKTGKQPSLPELTFIMSGMEDTLFGVPDTIFSDK